MLVIDSRAAVCVQVLPVKIVFKEAKKQHLTDPAGLIIKKDYDIFALLVQM